MNPKTQLMPSLISFYQLTAKLNIDQVQKEDAVSFLNNSFPRNLPSIKMIPVTENEIKSILYIPLNQKLMRLL